MYFIYRFSDLRTKRKTVQQNQPLIHPPTHPYSHPTHTSHPSHPILSHPPTHPPTSGSISKGDPACVLLLLGARAITSLLGLPILSGCSGMNLTLQKELPSPRSPDDPHAHSSSRVTKVTNCRLNFLHLILSSWLFDCSWARSCTTGAIRLQSYTQLE